MSGTIQVTKNEYFSYVRDENTEITFRTKDQVWNVLYRGTTYEIHVAGPNAQPGFVGRYNAFAKKHLLTVAGGKQGGGQYPSALQAVRDGNARKNNQSFFDRAVRGKLSGIHTKRQHGDFHDYDNERQEKHDEMTPEGQGLYQVSTLGGRSQDTIVPLTMVLCDLLSPNDLKEAFAEAIAARRPTAAGLLQHVAVRFAEDCVFQHDDKTNDFERGDTIQVDIYIVSVNGKTIVAHVVHCRGT